LDEENEKTSESALKKEAVGEMALILKYDSDADVLVVRVREGALAEEELLDNDVILAATNLASLFLSRFLTPQRKGFSTPLWSWRNPKRKRQSYSSPK
jgi:hypothetical protein